MNDFFYEVQNVTACIRPCQTLYFSKNIEECLQWLLSKKPDDLATEVDDDEFYIFIMRRNWGEPNVPDQTVLRLKWGLHWDNWEGDGIPDFVEFDLDRPEWEIKRFVDCLVDVDPSGREYYLKKILYKFDSN